jgi:phosphatidylethanolamine-binding protein (PEBP) family uncharacterized protein
MSYAVTLNHVGGGDHWAIWDIPASVTSLPENIDHVAMPAMPAGSKQSSLVAYDGFTGTGYLGPCPQAHNSVQMYTFTVYAMKTATLAGVAAGAAATPAQAAVRNGALPNASATLTGTQIQIP